MENQELYNYLKKFIILGDNNQRFIEALSSEYAWTEGFSRKVYEEYLKFIYLTTISSSPLTPSVQIDKVWKFHLGYSESYWHKLCENILKKPLHRHFTSDFNKGVEKDFFQDAQRLYLQEFKEEPPLLIWRKDVTLIHQFWLKRYCIASTSFITAMLVYDYA